MNATVYLVQELRDASWSAYHEGEWLGRYASPEVAADALTRQQAALMRDCAILVCDRHDCWTLRDERASGSEPSRGA